MDMKLREAMIGRILGGANFDPMAQQKAAVAPEQFRLDTPMPIQKSTYLRPPPPEAPIPAAPFEFGLAGNIMPGMNEAPINRMQY